MMSKISTLITALSAFGNAGNIFDLGSDYRNPLDMKLNAYQVRNDLFYAKPKKLTKRQKRRKKK